MTREPVVRYLDETDPVPCPYGQTRRVVTGGLGGVANVHHITVTEGGAHFHQGYDEVYYVLQGRGELRIDGEDHPLRPGAVAVIPSGAVHSLKATSEEPLEFMIVGVPAMPIEDERFVPRKPDAGI